MTFARDANEIVGENGRLRVVFDDHTGAVRKLENLVSGTLLVDGDATEPWRMMPQGARARSFAGIGRAPVISDTMTPTSCDIRIVDDVATFTWQTTEDG